MKTGAFFILTEWTRKTDSALFIFLFHSFIFLLTSAIGHTINDLSKDEMVSSDTGVTAMANSHIIVTHSCGHEETHHFTKSAAMNRRAAKYKENETCSECQKMELARYREEKRAREEANLGSDFVASLPEIEAVSEKQKTFAEARRASKLNVIVSARPKMEEKLAEGIEDGYLTEEEAALFRDTLKKVSSFRQASFWIDHLTEDDLMIFSHILALTIALNKNALGGEETLDRLKKLINRRVFRFEWSISVYEAACQDEDGLN